MSKLTLFNGALRVLGERNLSSLSENVAARHELDSVWDDGFRDDILEMGLWNFAMRTTQEDFRTDVEPEFGYRRAYLKPDDWIRTAAISGDEYFTVPLDYEDQRGYWFADIDEIYVKYVSADGLYGYDEGNWPQSFKRFAEAYLAYRVAPAIAPPNLDMAFNLYKKLLVEARSRDAMNEPSKRLPEGEWTRARRGSLGRDRGSRHSLYG